MHAFLSHKWYFDEIYKFIFVNGAALVGDLFWKVGDKRIIDGLGPDGPHFAEVSVHLGGRDYRFTVTGETIPTELEGLLRDRDIDKVVVVGLATDYCVSSTALDAARLGFGTEVLQDAIAAVNLKPGDGAAALGQMRAAGCSLGYCFGTLP